MKDLGDFTVVSCIVSTVLIDECVRTLRGAQFPSRLAQ